MEGMGGVVTAEIPACNFGDTRQKRVRLLTKFSELRSLEGPCTGRHPHRHVAADGSKLLHAHWSWKRERAQYTLEFCDAVLKCFKRGQRMLQSVASSTPQADTFHSQPRQQHQCRIEGSRLVRAAGTARQLRGSPKSLPVPVVRRASQRLLSRKRSVTKRSPLAAFQVAGMELYVT